MPRQHSRRLPYDPVSLDLLPRLVALLATWPNQFHNSESEIKMGKLTEFVTAVTHAIHLLEPLLFKLALTTLALYELWSRVIAPAFGHAEG